MLWVPVAPKWERAECCKSHEWKELIPVSFVHTVTSLKTQGLFSILAFFRAKNRLLSSANGECSLDVMSVFLLACSRNTVIQAISVKVTGIFGI